MCVWHALNFEFHPKQIINLRQAYNLNTQEELAAGIQEIQGCPWLCSKFKAKFINKAWVLKVPREGVYYGQGKHLSTE